MKSIAKLKEEARALEKKASWAGAIELYLQVLTLGEQTDQELDLSLYNRIGDLYLRLDRKPEAVDCYERAAERYAEAGLINNAIALCNKALRYQPERASVLKRLARLSLQQGFRSDARRWYLEYADRKQQEGDLKEALAAVAEFAEQAEAPDVRELLGNMLIANGRFDEGLAELVRAYGELLDRPDGHGPAAVLREQIVKLAPHAVLPPSAGASEAVHARPAGVGDVDPITSGSVATSEALGAVGAATPGSPAPAAAVRPEAPRAPAPPHSAIRQETPEPAVPADSLQPSHAATPPLPPNAEALAVDSSIQPASPATSDPALSLPLAGFRDKPVDAELQDDTLEDLTPLPLLDLDWDLGDGGGLDNIPVEPQPGLQSLASAAGLGETLPGAAEPLPHAPSLPEPSAPERVLQPLAPTPPSAALPVTPSGPEPQLPARSQQGGMSAEPLPDAPLPVLSDLDPLPLLDMGLDAGDEDWDSLDPSQPSDSAAAETHDPETPDATRPPPTATGRD